MASGTIYAQAGWTGYATSGNVTQRAYLTYSTSETPTVYNVTVTSGIQQWNGSWNNIGVTCSLTNYGSSSSKLTLSNGSYHLHPFFSGASFSYAKSKTTQSVTITGTSTITSGVDSSHGSAAVLNKPSNVYYYVSVPPIDNYTVAYNANGGENAPESQTKWYNEDLTLQGATPTKSGYLFVGWNTAADGTGTTYQPSATYSANEPLTLYAMWKNVVSVKVNGAWKVGEPSVKVSGEWKQPDKVYVKVGGTWKST